MGRQYLFLHIPKTAGTSLITLMRTKFGDRFRETDAQGLFWHRQYLGDFDCITGHIPFFVLSVEDRPRDTLCIVRHPVDRVLSSLNHFWSEAAHPAHQLLTRRLLEMPDMLHTLPFALELSNLQTRMLGIAAPNDLLLKARSGDFRAFQEFYSYFVTTKLDDDALARARFNVSNIRLAMFEDLGYSVSQVLESIVPPSSTMPHLRAPAHRLVPSPELLQAIADANRLDLLLYEAAREQFNNCAARQVLAKGELIDLPGAPKAFVGLHQLEEYRGEPLRWTDGAASLDILTPAEIPDVRLAVTLWDLEGRLEQQQVTVAVDGTPMAQSADGGRFVHEIVSRPIRSGSTRAFTLTITSTATTFAGDPRTLGVPIRSISICRQ